MRVTLPDGKIIGPDCLVSDILRFDCIPSPISLEFQVILSPETDEQLQENSVIQIGDDYLELKIIKRVTNSSGFLKDDKILNIGAFVAFLNGTENLIKPTSKAIYLENTTIGAALRASGSKLKVIEDVPLQSYFCPVGATPSYEIARKLREEAAVMFCTEKGQLVIKRLSQLLDGEPVLTLDETAVKWMENTTQLNHTIPTFQTVNADGSTIEGELKGGAKTAFYPNLDARRLKNLSTVLVTRGTVMRPYDPLIKAGDVVMVKDKKYVILTAAHRYDSGVLGAPSVTVSKYWLAEVVKG